MSLPLEQALAMANQALEDDEFVEALSLANQVLAQAPDDPDALELKGLALAELGELEEADAAFAALLRRHPHHVTALLGAADVKIRQPGEDRERLEEGLALLARAAPRVGSEEAMNIELWLLRGIAHNQLGDFEAALDAFDRVLRLDPEHSEAMFERAQALFEQGTFGAAKKQFERLAKDFPEDPWSFHYLGLLAERRGEDPEPWFSKARQLDPDEFPPPTRMSIAQFDAAVADAIAKLPEHAKAELGNTIISVEPIPSDEEVAGGVSPIVLGVCSGTAIDERLDLDAASQQTVRITLFQKNLERFARSREELLEEIRITVLHEVGHLLGLDEDELYERGLD